MEFAQIVEFTTDNIDEMIALGTDYQVASGLPGSGATLYKDRDRPNTYLVVARFPSPEAAEENNNRPETQALNEKMGGLATSAPSFRNLDVVHSWGD